MAVSGVSDLAGRVLAGRYRLLTPIGAGASGRVYLADDIRLSRRVAVKVLHAALAEDAGFLRRFRAEAQVAASLHHPNVMAVYDWGEDEVPFMVLELLEGGSLRAMLDHGHHLSPAQAAHVGRQVANALEYAHTRGLVHRDIKPANLLFDEHGIVRVADFGLARALAEASWTEPAGAMLGTARYAAPEQGSGRPLDGRADLYSLAVVLVESVTGKVPHQGETTIAMLATRATTPIVAPPELGPLGAVVERAGKPDVDDRYPDAATMSRALADAGRALPPPGPLVLVGPREVVADLHPTQLRKPDDAPGIFDQDAGDLDDGTVTRAVPITDDADSGGGGRRSDAKSWIPAVVLGTILAVVLGAIAMVITAPNGASTAVPQLVGTTQEAATAAAKARDLGVTVSTRRIADDPAGIVIGQVPAAGAWLASGEQVTLILSAGPQPVVVPATAGKTEVEGKAILEAQGFVVSPSQHEFSETVPAGLIIRTEPFAEGKGAPPESTIAMVISDGREPKAIPDVHGDTFDEAANILQQNGFPATQVLTYSDTVAVNEVIGTVPAFGGKAVPGTAVQVLVSQGPQPITLINYVGQSIEASTKDLAARGLVADVKNYRPGGLVRTQSPAAGTVVHKGDTVTLTL